MVYPTNNTNKYLSLNDKEQLFAYIFADILYRKGISSSQLDRRKWGDIEAKVILDLEVVSLQRPEYLDLTVLKDDWIPVRLKSGRDVFVVPTLTHAVYVMFSTSLGRDYAYAEISFKKNKTGFTLDSVIRIQRNWIPEANGFSYIKKMRILKASNYGRRSLLVEAQENYVVDLPEVSDCSIVSFLDPSTVTRPEPTLLVDYLSHMQDG